DGLFVLALRLALFQESTNPFLRVIPGGQPSGVLVSELIGLLPWHAFHGVTAYLRGLEGGRTLPAITRALSMAFAIT
ncbi:MAG: hypothetical protein ACYC3V_19590, partial [Chloroflexota bacterium]